MSPPKGRQKKKQKGRKRKRNKKELSEFCCFQAQTTNEIICSFDVRPQKAKRIEQFEPQTTKCVLFGSLLLVVVVVFSTQLIARNQLGCAQIIITTHSPLSQVLLPPLTNNNDHCHQPQAQSSLTFPATTQKTSNETSTKCYNLTEGNYRSKFVCVCEVKDK